MSPDHVLIIGFGGPTRPQEIQPFLENVTRGLSIPPRRLQEVLQHYAAIGGASPYHAHTRQFAESLTNRLRGLGVDLPVFVGMRHWHPFLSSTIPDIFNRGLRQGLGFILAPHRSDASFNRYVEAVEQAIQETYAHGLQYSYLQSWHDHPLFIEAQAEAVQAVLESLPLELRQTTHLIFSAHSIPQAMARCCAYDQEIRHSSASVAQTLGHPFWTVAYQSRSGKPDEPWLQPEVSSVLKRLAHEGVTDVVFVPIGFLCDHAEVLYDLDIEARAEAKELKLRYSRAATVMDHPKFVKMTAALISSLAPISDIMAGESKRGGEINEG